jgi:hypothetical protein
MTNFEYKDRIVDYLKKNLKKNYTLDSLKLALIRQGYSRVAIEKAIEQVHKELARKAPILKEKPKIKYNIIDENDNPITIKKSFWKRIFGL